MCVTSHEPGGWEASAIDRAIKLGACSAATAVVADLKRSPTYAQYDRDPYRPTYRGIDWPEDARSLFVFAVRHPRNEPELDWWGNIPGGTSGNLKLIRIANKLQLWFQEHTQITAVPLPYQVEQGGVFLKDAAHLAGIGVIGRNNMLITPEFGSSVRLRGMFLNAEAGPAEKRKFDPCSGCPAPCFDACPQGAFDSGRYARARCELQMNIDRANAASLPNPTGGPERVDLIRCCRACEFACPFSR